MGLPYTLAVCPVCERDTISRILLAGTDVFYRCTVCGHIYDPAEGDPETGIAPGTPFEAIPEDWACPDCGATKADFEPMED